MNQSFCFLILATTIAASSSALCYPSQGDKVIYATIGSDPALTMEYENQGFDEVKNVWHVSFSSTYDDVTQSQGVQDYSPDDMISSEKIHEILSSCTQAGGVFSDIDVPAGHFDTCYIRDSSGTEIWFGDVPFGIVAFDVSSRPHYHFELSSYEVGQDHVFSPSHAIK